MVRPIFPVIALSCSITAFQPVQANAPFRSVAAEAPVLLEVVGKGSITSPADRIVLHVLVKDDGLEKLATDLVKLGINKADITSNGGFGMLGNEEMPFAASQKADVLTVSVSPEGDEPDPPTTKITHITLRDVRIFEDVTAVLKRHHISTFFPPATAQLNDPEPARRLALYAALTDARRRAEQLAGALHAQIDHLSSVSMACTQAQQENLLAVTFLAGVTSGERPDPTKVTTIVSICAAYQTTPITKP